MADNEVTIKLTVEGNAKVALNDATKAVEQFGNKGQTALNKFNTAFQVFAGTLASRAVSAGFVAISRAVTEAARNFLEFDKAVAEVNTLLGKNEKLTKETTDTFIEFSSTFGGKATTQAKAFYQVVSAGITDTARAIKVLEAANKAAVAGISDVETAVDGLTSVLNAYGSSNITVTEISDTLFTAIKEGKTTLEELSSTIGRVTPIAAAAGVKFSEVAGSLAFLTSKGISTDEAVTSLRAAIVSIIKPSEGQIKAAKQLGIEFNAAALKSKGFEGIMRDVLKVTGGNTAEMAKLFPNVRALGAVAAIAGKDFEGFADKLEATSEAAGATGDAFEKVAKSASFQFEILQQSIENVGLQIFQDLEPIFAEFLTTINANKVAIQEFISQGISFAVDATINLIAATQAAIIVFMRLQQAALVTSSATSGAMKLLALDAKGFADSLEETSRIADQTNEAIRKFEDNDAIAKLNELLFEMKMKSEGAAAAQRELAVANTETNEGLSETAEVRKQELDELTDAQTKLINATIQGGISALEKEKAILKELQKLNKKRIGDKTQLTVALIAQEQKISDMQKAEALKRQQFEAKIAQERLSAASTAFGNLATLSRSKNKELAAIGKASAIAQTTIDTYAGAQKAFTALAGIPIVGPALGIAAAAAAIVAGLARVAEISGTPLQTGITEVPGIGTADNFPATLAPKERVLDANTNQDLKGFLSGAGGMVEILASIDEKIGNLENEINVNIAGEDIVNTSIEAARGGRTIPARGARRGQR
jgi:TP901 family phage tail tape measure protein